MESIEKVGFANGATERLSEINLNDFLTDAEFSHRGYHPMRDFLSAIADVTIILPLVEGIMGYDFITQEELTDLERGFKIGGALVDAFTLGASGVFTNAGMWATSGLILKTMAADAAVSGVTYMTNEMLTDVGFPPAVAGVMTVIASGVVTYSAGKYFFKNASGDLVAEYTVSELRQIFKEIDNVEIPPVKGSAVEEAIKGGLDALSTPSSKALRQNLIEAGVAVPDYPNAAHHIVAGNSPKAAEARAILQKYGIDINDAANGVFLPTAKDVAEGAYHPSLHTNAYYDEVNNLLSGVTSKQDAVDVLNYISESLQNGTFMQ